MGDNMNIFFVGGIFREDKKSEIVRNSKIMPYFAAHAHQKSIIEGLEYFSETLTIINAVHVASFPKGYSKIYIKGSRWSHNNSSSDIDLGFINFFGLKHVWRAINLSIGLFLSLSKCNGNNNRIVSYGLHFPFLVASFVNRKIFKRSVKWCVVIPEVPKFYIGKHGKTLIYNILKKIDWYLTHILLKKADYYELITADMADLLGIKEKPFIVSEAIIKKNDYDIETKLPIKNESVGNEGSIKKVLYTGTTDIEFGIEDLLKAFQYIDDENYRLIIFGSGSGDSLIKKISQIDERICYMGFIPREEIIQFQKQATVLVNPRTPEGEFTKYSFPSKTLEYMISGNPVLMHKLPGIPNEYDRYLKFFRGVDYETMANDIQEICNWSKEERLEFGYRAQQFVLENKNEIEQGKRLYDLITQN